MSTLNQKKVIKSYKLRLQEKFRIVSDETGNAVFFLNNCLKQFEKRVQTILDIKDEKCLSLYRKLIKDLENYSEKLFILQTAFDDASDESDSENESKQENEKEQLSEVSSEPSSAPISVSFPNSRDISERDLPSLGLQKQNSDVHESPIGADGDNTEDDVHSLQSDAFISDSHHSENAKDCQYETAFSVKNESLYSNALSSYHSLSVKNESLYSNPLSSYHSLSSESIENVLVRHSLENVGSQTLVKTVEDLREITQTIPLPTITVPCDVSGTLSHIVDPGNFWLQLKGDNDSILNFPRSHYFDTRGFSSLKENVYCLAPYKSSPFYFRAKSITNSDPGTGVVTLFFIDDGFVSDVHVSDLRELPSSVYDIPAQALHCFLYQVAAVGSSWSEECIKKFTEFNEFSIKAAIKIIHNNMYGVELTAIQFAEFDEDFSIDIAQSLYIDGLAVLKDDPMEKSPLNNWSERKSFEQDKNCDSNMPLDLSATNNNATSCDSGVSVTSTYKSTQDPSSVDYCDKIDNSRQMPGVSVTSAYKSNQNSVTVDYCNKNDNHRPMPDVNVTSTYKSNQDAITVNHCDKIDNSRQMLHKNNEYSESKSNCTNNCSECKNRDIYLQLTVPSPAPVFVEKNMMIVMLSHIVDPSEFYVNMAMENIMTLDELREQMTSFYSQSCFKHIDMSDVHQGMFCAAYYKADDYWYRVKVLNIRLQDDTKSHVLVHYIDYGNCALVKCSDLRPLLPQFTAQPSYALRCSLAGVVPLNPLDNSVSPCWNDNAVKIFKEMISLDKCFTAQVCNEVQFNNCETLEILLWDTEGSKDVLINLSLADCGIAKYDSISLNKLSPDQLFKRRFKDSEVLSSWDPMAEDYYGIENSYGVCDDDIQVATTGYKSKDLEYTCKYFALRGKCPKGSKCSLEHIPLLEDGTTRDQEEEFCLDLLPVIPKTDGHFLIQISAIVHPWHFYVVFPFGTKTVDEIDSLIHNGCTLDDVMNKEVPFLYYAMNKHYSSAPFQENTKLALVCGTIVAAKRKWDQQWMRGRVINVVSIEGPAQIYFVDSGDNEWVPRKYIRTIEPHFLHIPFQAIECRLQGVEPIGFASGESWCLEAINFFKTAVDGQYLLANIVSRINEVLYLSIRKTSKHDHEDLAEYLVSYGFARHSIKSSPKSHQSNLYIPG